MSSKKTPVLTFPSDEKQLDEWKRQCAKEMDPDARWNWSFFHMMHQFHELIGKEIDRRLTEAGLPTFSQFLILLTIHTINKHPMLTETHPTGRSVAKFLMCTEASVSRLINRLEEEGYVTITQDPKRRSANILGLTKKGERDKVLGMELITKVLDEHLSHIPKKDRPILEKHIASVILKLDPSQILLSGSSEKA